MKFLYCRIKDLMKKFFLFTALLFATSAAFSQNVLSLFNKANNFFYYLEEAKYDSAHLYFDPSEQAKVTPAMLKQIWEGIKAKLGQPKSIGAIQSKVQGDFFSVIVEGNFEHDDQNFILAFNKQEFLVGLFMPPKVATYTLPSYADTAAYREESVYIGPKERQLATVITVPKQAKNFPVIVFVHGSGPNDMDETVGANKPFKDLALGLAAKGIASLRYVKRTVLYASDFANKAFTVKEEVTDDALLAIQMAKTIKGADPKQIYVFGHSLGGMLAPRLATLTPELNGIILAAAPARKLTDIIVEQNKYFFARMNDTTETSKKQFDEAIKNMDRSRITQLGGMKPDSLVMGLPAVYWADLNSYDQVETAKKLNKRIFVLQGGNDFQVSRQDYDMWDAALNKKKNATLRFYPELNHLLTSQAEKGTTEQYQKPANVAGKVIEDIALWVNKQPLSKE